MLYIIFGQPGAGKTYLGELIRDHFHYTFHDGDDDLTEEIKVAVKAQKPITSAMRVRYFEALFRSIATKRDLHKRLVVSQTFIKEQFREQALERFPETQFLLVTASPRIRIQRLQSRVTMPLSGRYVQNMFRRFEEPSIPHISILNNEKGKKALLQQLSRLIK